MYLFRCHIFCLLLSLIAALPFRASSQVNPKYTVIAYYLGGPENVSAIDAKKLSHVIYSFATLNGNKLNPGNLATIKRLVALKKQNPALKVLLAFAGWGGCKTCSDLFTSHVNRRAFALSVLNACKTLGVDGIDLDWEYPTIEGFIGHKYSPQDKETFTLLVQQLRETLGNSYEISFAAGAFSEYLEKSIDWVPVMKEVDRVNLMTYDLVNGYSKVTGHHTPLYSTHQNKESADHAVSYLLQQGIPANKIVIGAAFYARTWQHVEPFNGGLYQPGTFRNTIAIKNFISVYTPENGFTYRWDDVAKAPYLYSPSRKLFVTFDNNRSVALKAEYVKEKNLNGIMFWQIAHDKKQNSLLSTIYSTIIKP